MHFNRLNYFSQPDGCAIFFKNDLFQLVNEFNVEFEQPGKKILNFLIQ